jgi:putative photosynthetic complex assembly protein 2
MSEIGAAALFALFVWWFSTGAVLWVIGLPERATGKTMIAVTAVGLAALFGLHVSADMATPGGAYLAFTCGVLLWAWHETSFLTGAVTGPRRSAIPAGVSGWERFRMASGTVMHHEVAIALTMALAAAAAYGGENQIGVMTFAILWLMRLSAKLNVFLGVPNLTEEFLPTHLAYLKTCFRKRPMNLLFPVSVTISTLASAWLFHLALAADASPFQATGYALLAVLMTLAVIEHWFLVLPLPVGALWSWGMRSRETVSPSETTNLVG